jgi:3-hydroxyanthranilate 3,4-dioxygenase
LNLNEWIGKNGRNLELPVSASLLHRSEEFFVMIVKGPNQRSDYHINPGNEWFFQLRSQLILRIIDERTTEPSQKFQETILNEEDIFMLPSHIFHCTVRSPESIGLVLEQIRRDNELNILYWYCEMCYDHLKLSESTTTFPKERT